jgi:hypothetical protein
MPWHESSLERLGRRKSRYPESYVRAVEGQATDRPADVNHSLESSSDDIHVRPDVVRLILAEQAIDHALHELAKKLFPELFEGDCLADKMLNSDVRRAFAVAEAALKRATDLHFAKDGVDGSYAARVREELVQATGVLCSPHKTKSERQVAAVFLIWEACLDLKRKIAWGKDPNVFHGMSDEAFRAREERHLAFQLIIDIAAMVDHENVGAGEDTVRLGIGAMRAWARPGKQNDPVWEPVNDFLAVFGLDSKATPKDERRRSDWRMGGAKYVYKHPLYKPWQKARADPEWQRYRDALRRRHELNGGDAGDVDER